MEVAGGLMTLSDLQGYEVSWETPVRASLPHTDLTLLSSPPPGSGSVLEAILGIAGLYQPSPPDLTRPAAWHRFVEACKFSFAKRTLLGDWNSDRQLGEAVRDAVSNLTSTSWWGEVVSRISDVTTSEDPAWYGGQFSQVEDGGTAHMSILSPAGDAVSVTSTINTLYGSKVVIVGFCVSLKSSGVQFMSPSTGIILNNQMDDFSYPNIINAYGVRPSESNMVAPGKRPVSSMSPTILVDTDNRVTAVVGASGGTKIITAVAQVLYRLEQARMF